MKLYRINNWKIQLPRDRFFEQERTQEHRKNVGSSVKCADAFRIAITEEPKLLIKQKYS